MKTSVFSVLAAIALLNSAQVLGADFYYRGTVVRILVSDTDYAGCMAETTPAPRVGDNRCTTKFVTFDCANLTGIGKASAANKLSAAQLAFITSRQVGILVPENADGTLATLDGHCLASRVDNF
jgi:hypothetical protein